MPLAPLSRRRKVNLSTVLGELVQTTAGKWITHPPSRCPNGHSLNPNQVLVGHVVCLGHGGVDTQAGTAEPAMPWCTGATQHPLHDAGRACDRAHLDIVDVSRFPRLAADSVIETEMGSEIPRDTDLRDHCDEDEPYPVAPVGSRHGDEFARFLMHA
jgi:hypothetical protein